MASASLEAIARPVATACADVLCVPCAFACVFLIPMRTIYQKLGRVRANHKIMILRPGVFGRPICLHGALAFRGWRLQPVKSVC
jgi:hypothetical protein